MGNSIHKGLSDEEVVLHRKTYGSNTLNEKSENRTLILAKEIILEPLFLILVCAAIIYFILKEPNEAFIMLGALIFVAGISFYQENKSRGAVEALKKLSDPLARVIRNNLIIQINVEDIVVGDLICVEDGNIIPADGLVLEAHDLSVNESILTGESLEINKEANAPNNILLQGTTVTAGSCIAQVTAVGRNTAFGKIGQSLTEIKSVKTPLQLQIQNFVRSLVGVGTIAFLVVWGVNYYLSKSILHGLLHGLTLAMSILPEEIPVAFSTFMALGAYHLHKLKVIALSPHTVETLGAATVICTDKTGTITKNEMQLAAIYDFSNDSSFDYTHSKIILTPVLEYAMWSSETEPFDSMEKSIHQAYNTAAVHDKRREYRMIREYPLGGKPPMMTHVYSNSENDGIIAVKGSVEAVLKHSKLNETERKKISDISAGYALKGYRILGVAKSGQNIQHLPPNQEDFEFDFLGLVAFYDPPKDNIINTLEKFYAAGISVKMITGDHPETALAIARQIHLKNSGNVLTGTQISEMTPEELRQGVNETDIYARMFPDAKLKIIEALKANGEVVAMTGDGVNDGPALKAAHIGIAMGLRGSEIAKKSASLILADDDLSHMTEAVAMGRRIYENLKKAIQYIISIHIPIILIVTLPLLLSWKYKDLFSPIHVIFLELIMGPMCSIVFEREPIEKNSMQKEPRKLSLKFFSFQELALSILQGLCITVACLGIAYYSTLNGSEENEVRTIVYTTLIFSNLFLTLSNRSFVYSVISTLRYKNALLPVFLFISLLVLFMSIYVPSVRELFQFSHISLQTLLQCLFSAFAGVMWIEIYKFIKRSALKSDHSA